MNQPARSGYEAGEEQQDKTDGCRGSREGTNSGLPATLGTAPLAPDAGKSAIRKCHNAEATKATLTHKATAVFNGI